MPPQPSLRTDQQSEPTKRVDGKSLQQCREERPVAGKEPRTVPAQLAFQDGDLAPQLEISTSLSRSLMGSRRSNTKALATPR